jgi:hypothetical protein
MTQVLQWLLAGVLSTWLLATILRNLPWTANWIARRDWMVLVPTWTLFARPRLYDIALLQREILPDGRLTSWREDPVVVERRPWSALWHPQLGPKRALLSLAGGIISGSGRRYEQTRADPGQGTRGAGYIITSEPYLVVLNYVSARCHHEAHAVQFMVLGLAGQALSGRYDTSGDGFVLFVSEFHRVGPIDGDQIQDQHGVREPVLAG